MQNQSQPQNTNPVAGLTDGIYHKEVRDNRIIVAGVQYKVPRKYMQTFVEVSQGKVYIINLDSERMYELEPCREETGRMRASL